MKFLELNKKDMLLKTLMTKKLISKILEQQLKLQLWLQVPITSNLGNL